MELLLFIGVVLVTAAVLFFVASARAGTLGQADRLALLPLEDEAPRASDADSPQARDQSGRSESEVSSAH